MPQRIKGAWPHSIRPTQHYDRRLSAWWYLVLQLRQRRSACLSRLSLSRPLLPPRFLPILLHTRFTQPRLHPLRCPFGRARLQTTLRLVVAENAFILAGVAPLSAVGPPSRWLKHDAVFAEGDFLLNGEAPLGETDRYADWVG